MPPPSLLQLSTATAIRNVKYLNDIGNIPYALARPFLLKIESPEKLHSLEVQSPHIAQDDREIWLDFIKRDIPRWEEYELPDESECWYDIYCDLREQVQKSVDEDAEKMKMALDGINSERAKHSAKFVTDRRTIRLPRERPTAKQRYASYDRKMGGIAPVFTGPKSGLSAGDPMGAPAWTFERPQLPRPETPRKKNTIFNTTKRNTALSVPTKHLNNKATQVTQAPRAFVEEHRRPAEPAPPRRKETPALIVPGRSRLHGSSTSNNANSIAPSPSLREREARLRELSSGTRVGSHTSNSPERPRPSSTTPAQSASSAPKPTPTSTPASSPHKQRGDAKATPQSQSQPRSSTPGESRQDGSDEKPSPAPAPAAIARKRQAPSIFMPPKKKKVT